MPCVGPGTRRAIVAQIRAAASAERAAMLAAPRRPGGPGRSSIDRRRPWCPLCYLLRSAALEAAARGETMGNSNEANSGGNGSDVRRANPNDAAVDPAAAAQQAQVKADSQAIRESARRVESS